MDRQRFIVHVDMDAFYASIEQRDKPLYRGKPVIVGADPKQGRGRGVVSACSYEARPFGIHSALPISQAYRKCPQAVFLPVDMAKYVRESKRVFHILERFTPDIEPISIDEAFLDITSSHHLFGSPEETCRRIKTAVKNETDLTASVGLAPNKMTAKIASDLNKPDGLVIVTADGLLDFLHPLPVEKLWGVGKKTLQELRRRGIEKIGQLAATQTDVLAELFGKHGHHIWKLANGIDPRPVEKHHQVKSIGNEHTFDADQNDPEALSNILMELCEKVSRRLRKADLRGQTVTLKIRFSDFSTHTRSLTLASPTNFTEDLFRSSALKLEEFRGRRRAVRLIGVQVSNLSSLGGQFELFGDGSEKEGKKERLHKAVDAIKDRFGDKAIRRR